MTDHTGAASGSPPTADEALAPPVPRWVGPVFFALALLTLPWIVYLGVSLPERALAERYNVAWVGFDIMLVIALARTAALAWLGRDHVQVPATITATLLIVDAWFDVVTAHGARALLLALLSAVAVELPLAAVCLWLVRHAEHVRRTRLHFFRARAAALRRHPVSRA
ncbi:MAG: hypothetical protein ACTHMZ_01860 [Actinomycetes bacterium]